MVWCRTACLGSLAAQLLDFNYFIVINNSAIAVSSAEPSVFCSELMFSRNKASCWSAFCILVNLAPSGQY